MSLARAEDALIQCREHIDAQQRKDPEIEAILARYVSAIIYAAFESEIRAAVSMRASLNGQDARQANFAKKASERLVRSIKLSELSGLAGWFHLDCKNSFVDRLDEESKTAWDSILLNRHDVAHDGEGGHVSNLTYEDVERFYPKAKSVITVFVASLTN